MYYAVQSIHFMIEYLLFFSYLEVLEPSSIILHILYDFHLSFAPYVEREGLAVKNACYAAFCLIILFHFRFPKDQETGKIEKEYK